MPLKQQSKETGVSPMVDHVLLIDGFSEKSKELISELERTIKTISEGRAPREETVSGLTASMSELRMAYSEIREKALAIRPEIEDDAPVSVYGEIFDEYEASLLSAQVDSLVSTLKRFVLVSADDGAYSAAVAPYQAEALEILKVLQSEEVSPESKLEISCDSQEAFIQAISMEDDELSSDKGEALLDSIESNFSRKVYRGVMLGIYKEPVQLPCSLNQPGDEIGVKEGLINGLSTEKADCTASAEIESSQSRPSGSDCGSGEGGESLAANSDTAFGFEREGDSAESVSLLPEDVNEAGACRSALESIGNVKIPSNVSASSFKKELASMPAMVCEVLPLIAKFGAMNETQLIHGVSKLTKNWKEDFGANVKLTVESLVRKGILTSFDSGAHGIGYVLTSYGKALLEKTSIKTMRSPKSKASFWCIPIGEIALTANESIKSTTLISTLDQAEMASTYLDYVYDPSSPKGFFKSLNAVKSVNNTLQVVILWGYRDYACMLRRPDERVGRNEDVLFVGENDESIDTSQLEGRTAFLLKGGAMVKWEGSWKAETASASQNEDSHADDSEINSASKLDRLVLAQPEVEEEPPVEEDSGAECSVEDSSVLQAQNAPIEADSFSEVAEIKTLEEEVRLLAAQLDPPSDDEFVSMAHRLLSNDEALIDPEDRYSNLAAAMTLLLAASTIDGYENSKLFFDQLVLSTGLAVEHLEKTGAVIGRSYPEYTRENEARVFASYCFALFSPDMAYDYDLRNAVDVFLNRFEEIFPSLVAFKPLLNELSGIGEISPEEGLSDNVLDMMGNQAKRSKRLSEMKAEAADLIAPPKIKAKLHGIPEFNAACFGKGSDLNLCMQIIEEDRRVDADFVNEVLDSYCIQSEPFRQIDESAIENKIDDEWHAAIEGKSTSRIRKLGSEPRKKAQDGFRDRLELMQRWVSYDAGKIDSNTLSKLKSKRSALIDIVDELADAGSLSTAVQGSVILDWMIEHLAGKLHSVENERVAFSSLLKTGIISLDDKMMPIVDTALNKVRFYEPWRNALRHICSPIKTFDEVRNLVLDDDSSDLFDNLRQLNHVNNLIGDGSAAYKVTESHFEQAEEAAETATEKFQDGLEIAYTYGLINEIQKEDLANNVEVFKDEFFSRADFGSWRSFLSALDLQINYMAAPQGEELRSRLQGHKESLKRGASSSLLDEAERLLVEERNYTVVEDYLNRFEAGQSELTDELNAKLHDPDLFSEFISDEVFKPIYDVCIRSKGMPLASFGKSFLKGRYPSDWTARQRESSESLIESWPVNSKRFKGETLAKLMKSIGFKVRGVPECVKKAKLEHYRVTVRPEASDRTDYRHPISAFGTQIKSPMNVLVLYGNYTPQEIIDVVAGESIVGEAVVFINHPISLSARRQMTEFFHTQKSRLTSFLLIDQVLALHLALHQETERMPLMLKCTLPFTYYQPFVRDSGPTADEMFCGREHELQTIIDPNGACVVYGGRQLGKTALLERAKSLRMRPDNGEYAVYVSILNCDNEKSVSQSISDAVQKAKLDFPECSSLRDVCKAFGSIMQKDVASRMLLLIDESDKFLASISGSGYSELQPLVDLKRETKNSFKFVLAGLHNVSRAKNATSRNGLFGQLGEPLCIKPLAPNEALQLISRPLTYLGFQVDRYPHLETILTSTNYYPGILQFFGYTLVETMTQQYGDYYRASDGNPPYALHKEQLGAIMNRSDLNNSIKEKFRWSLELDSRYFMIARCIALMCYDSDGDAEGMDVQKGFLADEIKQWADDLGVLCLEGETSQSYVNLLDEMVDMGILVRPVLDVARYRLRRNSFLNIIGSDLDSVLEDIDSNNVREV